MTVMKKNITFKKLTLGLLLGTSLLSSAAPDAAAPLDVNDVSFLWPVPKTADDEKTLISADELLADGGAGPVWRKDFFDRVIADAKKAKVKFPGGESSVQFSDAAIEKAHTWKVAGIRFNPSQLGTVGGKASPIGEAPGIRFIMQPVTVDGESVLVHDVTAHVVFSLFDVAPPPAGSPMPVITPDREAFKAVVAKLRALKELTETKAPTKGPLNVHPALKSKMPEFAAGVRDLLKVSLKSKQLQTVSFMGIEPPEPWIFFAVKQKGAEFVTEGAQGFQFKNVVEPKTTKPGQEVTTALLFGTGAGSKLNSPALPSTQNEKLKGLLLKDVADHVANPELHSTLNMDCVSCHTESTRRSILKIGASSPGVAYKHPDGVSGVEPSLLPTDLWNLRNFGWGLLSFSEDIFGPTVSQRAANEAAESAAFINENYKP